jgi:hypothetical protein
MSGTVMLTSRSGKTYRIRVNPRDKLKRSAGRFRRSLPYGTYAVADTVSKDRGEGNCPIFHTRRTLGIPSTPPVTMLRIHSGKTTYIRINCFGH